MIRGGKVKYYGYIHPDYKKKKMKKNETYIKEKKCFSYFSHTKKTIVSMLAFSHFFFSTKCIA